MYFFQIEVPSSVDVFFPLQAGIKLYRDALLSA